MHLIAGFDFKPPPPANVDLLLIQAIGWCFYDILGFLDRLHDPTPYHYGLGLHRGRGHDLTLLVRAMRRACRPA